MKLSKTLLMVVALTLGALACDGGNDPAQPRYTVFSFAGDWGGKVTLKNDDQPVANATVTMNGETLSYRGDEGQEGYFLDDWETPVSEGDAVNLKITVGEAVITANGALPEKPVLTQPSPTSAHHYQADEMIPVRWTSPTNPDRFLLVASWLTDSEEFDFASFEVDGGERGFDLPAGELPTDGRDVFVNLQAENAPPFSGPLAEDSGQSMTLNAVVGEVITIMVSE